MHFWWGFLVIETDFSLLTTPLDPYSNIECLTVLVLCLSPLWSHEKTLPPDQRQW